MSIIHRAHEIQEQHQALGPEPTTYPCKVKCKCGAEIEAINRDALTVVFVNHVVMEALAGQPSGVGEPRDVKQRAYHDCLTIARSFGGVIAGRIQEAIARTADEAYAADGLTEPREVGEGLREALQAIWNLARESEYSRSGELPSNEWLNSTVQWWMTHGKELKDYDKPDFSWAALAAPAPKPFANQFIVTKSIAEDDHTIKYFDPAGKQIFISDAPAPKPAPPQLTTDEVREELMRAGIPDSWRISIGLDSIAMVATRLNEILVRRAAERKPPR